jgi:hypothetical protein
MPALQPGASVFRGMSVSPHDWDWDTRDRVGHGEATLEDLLPLINTQDAGQWWAHPDYGGRGLANDHSYVEPAENITHPDGYGRSLPIVLEAEGPEGWDPKAQFRYTAPDMAGETPSVVPENTTMRLRKIHYQGIDEDGWNDWHSIDVPKGHKVHVGPHEQVYEPYETIKTADIPDPVETSDEGVSGEQKDNGMVALIPTKKFLDKLHIDGGEPIEQIHLTLKFLPGAGDWDDDKRQKLLESCEDLVNSIQNGGPVTGKVFGTAEFNPDDNQCAVYLVSGIDWVIEEWRDYDLEELLDLEPDKYGAWIPHITAGYDMDPDELDAIGEIEFDILRCVIGGDQYDFPLGSE